MTNNHQSQEHNTGSVVLIERVFDAPLERLWQAWSDPQQFMRWWGVRAFTTPVAEIDFRLGGKYLYCMRAPDGQDIWGTGVYREIVDRQRIVFSDSFADAQGNPVPGDYYGMGNDFPDDLEISVTLEDIGNGRTRQTLEHIGMPAGELAEMTTASWNESFDKLAELLSAG